MGVFRKRVTILLSEGWSFSFLSIRRWRSAWPLKTMDCFSNRALRTQLTEEAHGAALPGRRHRERTEDVFVGASGAADGRRCTGIRHRRQLIEPPRGSDIPTQPAIAAALNDRVPSSPDPRIPPGRS